MDQAQGIELARDFVQREMVDRGMVADLNVHWDIGPDGLAKPHAHVMLSMREVGEDGFGAKVRDWNRTELVEHWREAWADHVNERLAQLDIDARIDHRSLEDQGIDLEPQNKIGPAAGRRADEGLEADRLDEHHEIARANGERIAEPGKSRIILTHTNDEVRDLNLTARGRLRQASALGEDVTVNAERGERKFAVGDRLMFLKNDRGLGVKNGMLGEIEQVSPTQMAWTCRRRGGSKRWRTRTPSSSGCWPTPCSTMSR